MKDSYVISSMAWDALLNKFNEVRNELSAMKERNDSDIATCEKCHSRYLYLTHGMGNCPVCEIAALKSRNEAGIEDAAREIYDDVYSGLGRVNFEGTKWIESVLRKHLAALTPPAKGEKEK